MIVIPLDLSLTPDSQAGDVSQERSTLRPRPTFVMGTVMPSLNTVAAFSALGAWTFLPAIAIQSNENGKWSVTVGAAAGEYEVVRRSCSGEVLSSQPVSFSTGGAVAEYEVSKLRLDLFGGVTSSDLDEIQDGSFFGGFAAYEGDRLGVGAGIVDLPGQAAPSLYLRIGSRDGTHFRMDALAPDPTPGVTGLTRLGVGFALGDSRGFGGLSAGRGLDVEEAEASLGPFAEVTIPLGGRFGMRIGGSYHFPEEHADWAAGLALRYSTP